MGLPLGEWSEEELGFALATLFDVFPRASLQDYSIAATMCVGITPYGPIIALIDALRARLQAMQDGLPLIVSPPKSPRRSRRSLVISPREVRRFRARPWEAPGTRLAPAEAAFLGEFPNELLALPAAG